MSAERPERVLRGAGFSLVGRGKRTPEDRWALAELDGLVVGAVADGLSDPRGSGRGGASGAVADEAVAAFVEHASRMAEAGISEPSAIVREAFEVAELAARTLAGSLSEAGGAAFVGACLDEAGSLAVVKVGDCRALAEADASTWRPVTPSDDADRQGALTAFLGATAVRAEVVAHRPVDRVLLLSDGGWRAGVPEPEALPKRPFSLVRDLVARARRAGETDDLTALAMERHPLERPAASPIERLAPMTFAVAGALFFAAGLVAATLVGGPP